MACSLQSGDGWRALARPRQGASVTNGQGRVGFIVVGMGGVGSSLLAGILAAREHLVHPDGSLVESGGRRPQVPWAELNDLELGAFELRDDDAHRAAVRAGFISRSLLDELRP